jgi:hypothetical protein
VKDITGHYAVGIVESARKIGSTSLMIAQLYLIAQSSQKYLSLPISNRFKEQVSMVSNQRTFT